MRRFLVTLIGSLFVLGLPNAVLAAPEQVEQRAKEIAVSIDGCNSGAGVIIEQQGTTYSVLTLKSLVANAQATCWIVAPDGSRTQITPASLSAADNRVNLAIVQFESDKTYRVANLGSSQQPKIGESIYIAAFKASKDSKSQSRTLQIEESKVLSWEEKNDSRHRLIYDKTLQQELPGAPVFNQAGEVIGIHGQEKSASSNSGHYGVFLQKSSINRSNDSKSESQKTVAPWFSEWSNLPRQSRSSNSPDRPKSNNSSDADRSNSTKSSSARRDRVAGTSDTKSSEAQSSPSSSVALTEQHQETAIEIYAARQKEEKGFPFTLILVLAGMSIVVVTVYSM